MLALTLWSGYASAAGFDVKTLEQLGYNADIADFFSSSRFLPGVYRVTLEVNAAQRYQEEVRFDQEGRLCLNAELADVLRLMLKAPPGECSHIETLWPEAQVKVFPGTFRVEITLPEAAFDPEKLRREEQGGYAALMNYDLYGNHIRGRNGQQQTLQAMLEPGVNISNWVIRNRTSYTKSDTTETFNVYETSATRDFPRWGMRAQVGEFGAGGALSGGLPVTGVQLSSNHIRRDEAVLVVPLQGSVASQSTLEVKQRGQVIYRTLLPAGPFSLTRLGQAMAGVEAEVDITEADGRKQHFTVTPGRDGEQGGQSGYQVALGRYRSYQGLDTGSPPALLMGEKTFSLGQLSDAGVGGMVSSVYQRLGWQGNVGDEQGNWVSGGMLFTRGRQQGAQLEGQGQVRLSDNMSLALSSQYRTVGFRDADEGLNTTSVSEDEEKVSRLRYGGGAALSWGSPGWGSLTYSLSHERYYHDSRKNWLHSVAYGTRIGRVSLSVNLQSSAQDRAAVYAGLSMPLGGGSFSSRLQRRQNNPGTLGNSWQGNVGKHMTGYLDVSRDANGEVQTSGNLSGNTAYTRVSAGASYAPQGSSVLSLSSSGTLGVVNNTWVTSPQRAGDTMVLVRVPGQSGVRVSAGGGTGLTDYAGDVLLPSVYPYMPVSAEVDTMSMPLNLRLDSTGTSFELSRGAVARREFRVTEVRQLLLTIRDDQGNTLSTGASIHDEKGQLLGTVLGDGNLMLVNEDIGKTLRARRANMNDCQIHYEVPTVFDPAVLYEERDAVCR
ncbi:fimbria/pilus outer membrane usher protein [Serratia marcescens]